MNIDWINRPRDEFNKLSKKVNRYESDRLSTKADDKKITLKNTKNVLRDISIGKIENEEKAKNEFLKIFLMMLIY